LDPVSECGGEWCNGLGGCGPCSPTLGCKLGYFCGSAGCERMKANGDPCSAAEQCVGGACPAGSCATASLSKGEGGICQENTECQSGQCVDGVCCLSDCSGACMACDLNGSSGTCAQVPPGADPGSECGLTWCAGGTCMASCDSNAGCKAGAFCNGQQVCEARRANGTGCSSGGECASGFCADGFCCDHACAGGACDTCSAASGAVANGACTLLSETFLCRAAAGPCDAAERCTGQSAQCPEDNFVPGGTSCGSPDVARRECSYANTCAEFGERSVLTKQKICDHGGTCGFDLGTETTETCSRSTDGVTCHQSDVVRGACVNTCSDSDGCACERSVTTTTYSCDDGTCRSVTDSSSEVCSDCG